MYTSNTLPTDGSVGPFPIGINYLDGDNLVVTLTGLDGISNPSVVPFTISGSKTTNQPAGTTFSLVTAVAVGKLVTIAKVIDMDTPVIDWNTSAELSKSNLRKNTVNLMEMAQTAYDNANKAHDNANKAHDNANTAYDKANTAYDKANTAYDKANTAYDTANKAHDKANTAYDKANTAYDKANTAYDNANTAYDKANTAYDKANTAYDNANTAQTRIGEVIDAVTLIIPENVLEVAEAIKQDRIDAVAAAATIGTRLQVHLELDFGTAPFTKTKTFVVAVSGVLTTDYVRCDQVLNAATGRSQDENEMAYIVCRAACLVDGTITIYAEALDGSVTGLYNFALTY